MKLAKEWISGFVDGDGCFLTEQCQDDATQPPVYRFCVSQDQRSVDVLYALKKEFGCGSVHKGAGRMYHFQVSKQEHLRDQVIPHFYRYPLQTKKKESFKKFSLSFYQHIPAPGEQLNVYSKADVAWSAGWFRGIVDAKGCFNASLVQGRCMPRFTLGLPAGNERLMEECRHFLRCGSLYKGANGFQVLQVVDVAHMEHHLIPLFETRGSAVLLRTIKRISFQKWRKIVRLMVEKKDYTAGGMEKIKRYQMGLNKHNQSLAIAQHSLGVVEDTAPSP